MVSSPCTTLKLHCNLALCVSWISKFLLHLNSTRGRDAPFAALESRIRNARDRAAYFVLAMDNGMICFAFRH